jgi:hypothetical protein
MVVYSVQQFRCLGNIAVESIRRHGDVLSFRGNTLILSLTVRCSGNVLPFCVTQAMNFSIPAFNRGLLSRCLVMNVLSGKSTSDLTIPAFRQHAAI